MVAIQPVNSRQGALIPFAAVLVAFAAFVIGGFGPNILFAILSVGVLLAGTMLLWRPGEPPILLLIFGYPWLQASLAIFHANWLGVDLVEYSRLKGDMNEAVALTLLGLLAQAIGMRFGAGPMRWQDADGARRMALAQPTYQWFRIYGISLIASFIVLSTIWIVPGLSQLMLALITIKWAFFFMLAYATFAGATGSKSYFAFVFFFELALGTGGYFSDFRTVFLVTLLALTASGAKISPRVAIGISVLGALMLLFGVVWTAIKNDYRQFVSGGQISQSINVDYAARVEKLGELVGNLDGEKMSKSVDQFILRVAYVEYFAVVLREVPQYIPYESGALLWDAISRPFMPRIFFPDKEIIDDTARTNFYTGGLGGVSENVQATSISLGYAAESYIDFGKYGMMISLFLVGAFYGAIYRHFLRWKLSRGLLGMGVSCAVLVSVADLGNSITKVFGGVVANFIMALLVVSFVGPRLALWLRGERAK